MQGNPAFSYQSMYNISTVTSTTLDFIASNLIPAVDDAYDIGEASLRWRDFYLAGNEIINGTSTVDTSLSTPTVNTNTIQSFTPGGDLTVAPDGNIILSPGGATIQCNRSVNMEGNDVDAAANVYTQTLRPNTALSPNITVDASGNKVSFSSATGTTLTNTSVADATFAVVGAADPTKEIVFSAAGNTTGKALTLSSAVTAARTQSYQDATDTFVYRNTVDLLKNKQVDAGNCRIVDDADATKALLFSVAANTTGTALTLASSVTAARTQSYQDTTDTFSYLSSQDFLNNKQFNTNSCAFADASDHTKEIAFIASPNAHNTTLSIRSNCSSNRVIDLPDASGSLFVNGTNEVLTLTEVDSSCALCDASDHTKKIGWSVSSATTGTALTIKAAQTANRLQTTQDASDTFVYLSTADLLANKSMVNGSCAHVDGSDATKKIVFSTAGATTGTSLTMASNQTASHTITVPVLGVDTTFATLDTGNIFNGSISVNGLSNPVTGPTLAIGGAGVLTGNYLYKYTFTTSAGNETATSPGSSVTTSSNFVSVTFPATSSLCSLTNIYRTKSGGSTYYRVTQVGTYSGGVYSDNVPDSSLVTPAPGSNLTPSLTYVGGQLWLPEKQNQITFGSTHIINVSAVAPAISTLNYTIPDAGANSSFVLTNGAQSLSGVTSFTNATNATSLSTGGVVISGGAALAQDLYMVGGTGVRLPNSGATNNTLLAYYEEFSDTAANNWSYNSVTFTKNVNFVRCGKMCTFSWNTNTQASTGASFFTYTVPTRFRPAQTYIHSFIRVLSNSVSQQGFIIYDGPSGKMQIYTIAAGNLQTNFSALGNCGFSEFSWSYCMN